MMDLINFYECVIIKYLGFLVIYVIFVCFVILIVLQVIYIFICSDYGYFLISLLNCQQNLYHFLIIILPTNHG